MSSFSYDPDRAPGHVDRRRDAIDGGGDILETKHTGKGEKKKKRGKERGRIKAEDRGRGIGSEGGCWGRGADRMMEQGINSEGREVRED